MVERWTGDERGGIRVGEYDCARRERGAEGLQWCGPRRGDRLRDEYMGLGHCTAMSVWGGDAWEPARVDERGAGCGELECRRVDGLVGVERVAGVECWDDGIGERDDERIDAGLRGAVRGGARRRHGMRGDGVVVGQLGGVPRRGRADGKPARAGDYGGAWGELVAGLLGCRCVSELVEADERRGDGVCCFDDARGERGCSWVQRVDACEAVGVRGNGVGVGHVDAMQRGARRVWQPQDDDECGRPSVERERRIFRRKLGYQHGPASKRSCDGVGELDGAWQWAWGFVVQRVGEARMDGLRAVELGVGHVGAQPGVGGSW